VSNVGGPRHYRGAGLPNTGWQCPICGHLNIAAGACAKCQDVPQWAPAQPKPTGLQAARAALAKVIEKPLPEPEPQEELSLNVTTVTTASGTDAMVTTALGAAYHGAGATIQEAIIGALAAMEEDLNRPKCPTCGQGWPEHLEYPTEQ
jgi:predicted RNA-binding Zn-ribbon protein involved in translation (DUF1610 family)